MPDKRKRFRTKKTDDNKQPTNGHVILAKRGDDQQRQPLIQPKILLKTRPRDNQENNSNNSDTIKTIIIHRSTDSSGTSLGNASSVSGIVGNTHNSHSATSLPNNSQQHKQTTVPSSLSSSSCYTTTRNSERLTDDNNCQAATTNTANATSSTHESSDDVQPQQMVRPMAMISSVGILNFNARKLLNKTNTDFLVVGVLGAQGVGKTTVLNLLSRDHLRINDSAAAYQRIFVDSENIFSTKIKSPTRARTEATYVYITGERMILVDTAPLLFNTQQRDITTNEIDELHNIVNMLTTCHLLIIVYNNYLDINLVRLLRLAILVKPQQLTKAYTPAYLPNIMFIKNRAMRTDFMPLAKQRMQTMLKAMFADTDLHIYCGSKRTAADTPLPTKPTLKDETKVIQLEQPASELPQQLNKDRTASTTTTTTENAPAAATATAPTVLEQKRTAPLNCMLLPDFKSGEATTFHPDLRAMVTKLRERVLATSRNKIFECGEFNEMDWFETVAKTVQEGMQHFEATYQDVMQKHLEYESGGGSGSGSGGNATTLPGSAGGGGNAAPTGGGGGGNKGRERNRERKAFRTAVKPFD